MKNAFISHAHPNYTFFGGSVHRSCRRANPLVPDRLEVRDKNTATFAVKSPADDELSNMSTRIGVVPFAVAQYCYLEGRGAYGAF